MFNHRSSEGLNQLANSIPIFATGALKVKVTHVFHTLVSKIMKINNCTCVII